MQPTFILDSPLVQNTTNNFRYFITTKGQDGSFVVIENIDSTNWIEWSVKREPVLQNMLYPSAGFSWRLYNHTGNGRVTLHDARRGYFSRLSRLGWFLKFPGDSGFWLYQSGSWSATRPIEISNGTRTFEICQKGVNNCVDGGDQPGCCGPQGDMRCCDFNTNNCVSC